MKLSPLQKAHQQPLNKKWRTVMVIGVESVPIGKRKLFLPIPLQLLIMSSTVAVIVGGRN
jgi:hypothetical protein